MNGTLLIDDFRLLADLDDDTDLVEPVIPVDEDDDGAIVKPVPGVEIEEPLDNPDSEEIDEDEELE